MDDIRHLIGEELYGEMERFISLSEQASTETKNLVEQLVALNSKSKNIELNLRINSSGTTLSELNKSTNELIDNNGKLIKSYSELQKAAAARAESDKAYAAFEKELAAKLAATTKELGRQEAAHLKAEKEVNSMWQSLLKEKEALEAVNAAHAELIKTTEQDILFTNKQEMSTAVYNKRLEEQEATTLALAEAQGANNIEAGKNVIVTKEEVAVVTQQITKSQQLAQQLFFLKDELIQINLAIKENNTAWIEGTITGQEYATEQGVLTEKQIVTQAQIRETTAALKEQNGILKASDDITSKFGNTVQRMGLRFIGNLVVFQAGIEAYAAISDKVSAAIDRMNYEQITAGEIAKGMNNNFLQESISLQTLKARFEDAGATMSEKKEIVKQLSDTIENQYKAITSVNEAEAFFRDKSAAFLQALQLRAEGEAAYQVVVKETAKQIELMADPKQALTGFDKIGVGAKSLFQSLTTFNDKNVVQKFKENWDWNTVVAGANQADTQLEDVYNRMDYATKRILETQQKAAKLDAANGFKTFANDPNSGNNTPKEHSFLNERLKAEQDYTKLVAREQELRLQAQNEADKTIYDDETKTLEDRLTAYRTFKGREAEIASEKWEAEANAAGVALKKISDIEKAAAAGGKVQNDEQVLLDNKKVYIEKQKVANLELDAFLEKNERETQEGITKIYEQEVRKRIKLLTEVQSVIRDKAAEESQALNAKFESGQISLTEYEAQSKIISDKARSDELKADADFWAKLLQDDKIAGEQRLDIEKKLSDAKQKIWEDDAAKYKEAVGKIKQSDKELRDTALNEIVQAAELEKQVVDANADNRIAQLERQKQAELDFINSSSASQQEKAAKSSLINKKYAEEEDKLARKKIAVARQVAIVERAVALAKIVFTTQEKVAEIEAQASVYASSVVTAPLAALALAQIPIVIGEAAIASGLILAAPLPQYAKGGTKKETGLALFGEQGAEMYRTPSGEIGITPPTPTVMDLPKFTHIWTAKETADMLKGFGMPSILSKQAEKQSSRNDIEMLSMLKDALVSSEQSAAGRIVNAIKSNNSLPQTWGSYVNNIIH